jgi:hypothetical protein
MKKPAGIAVSAVFALLGSLLMLLFFVLICSTVLLSSTPRPLPPQARLGLYLGLALFGFLGTWGTVTAIGLFRFRNWARISIIVFSVLLALTGITAGPVMFLIPAPATAPPNFHAIQTVIAGVYGALGLLGGFWVYYFCRRTTREAFGETAGMESGGRPLSLSIIGWWLLVTGAMAVLMAPFRLPGSIFIWIATGWAAAAWYAAYGAMYVYAGYGVLRLNPLARKIAIFALCFGAVSGLTFFVAPGADARMAALMLKFNFGQQLATQYRLPTFVYAMMAVPGVGLPLWFLFARKSAFQAEPSPSIPQL